MKKNYYAYCELNLLVAFVNILCLKICVHAILFFKMQNWKVVQI